MAPPVKYNSRYNTSMRLQHQIPRRVMRMRPNQRLLISLIDGTGRLGQAGIKEAHGSQPG